MKREGKKKKTEKDSFALWHVVILFAWVPNTLRLRKTIAALAGDYNFSYSSLGYVHILMFSYFSPCVINALCLTCLTHADQFNQRSGC